MDNADRAQRIIDMRINHALTKNKAQFSGEDKDETECQECGIQIPEARRKAIHSCKYCVDCQDRIERKNKHFQGR